MPNIKPLNLNEADAKTTQTLNGVKAQLGMIPNLFTTFALAPAVLNAYLQFSANLSKGRLTAAQREIIALAVAQTNGCQYCLSAHTLLGKGAGLDSNAIQQARAGVAGNTLDAAIAAFAVKVTKSHGHLDAHDLSEVRTAGVDDALIIEIIANVSINILTNYTNNIAHTVIDFPVVSL